MQPLSNTFKISAHDTDDAGDVCIIALSGLDAAKEGAANVINFIGDEAFRKLGKELEEGEPVYKIGHSTGLTVGRLKDANVPSKKVLGNSYNDVVTVTGMLSFHGDCGALYCVARIISSDTTGLDSDVQAFYPFAVHCNSLKEEDEVVAVGQNLWNGLDTLGLDFTFVNTSWNRYPLHTPRHNGASSCFF